MRSWLIATQVANCSFVLIGTYQPDIFPKGDTLKQLLSRSKYLLFEHYIKWTAIQKHRTELLFERYPQLKKAYQISLTLGDIFKLCNSKEQAFK
ncbi:transposase [Pedobacter sp. CFBP9032]|uniref:transposase n=1 Tax=Pedobacter sp. CFBP9032 TaxID=3096539 RepID=UPI0039C95C32